MKEPSVLDYIKSFLKPNREQIRLLNPENAERSKLLKRNSSTKREKRFPFGTIFGIVLALIAQSFLDAPTKKTRIAIPLYLLAAVLIWLENKPKSEPAQRVKFSRTGNSIRLFSFCLSLILVVLAFVFFSGNRFTLLNLSLWLSAIVFFLCSVWEIPTERPPKRIHLSTWHLLIILAGIVVLFFRTYNLQQVPGEMFSDHAEKLLDVVDVLNGQYSIFFPRNTGREAFQFYLTAMIIKILGTGISFTSLKIGTIFAGLLTLPYIYLLGKELAGRWVGLAAFFLAGIAYWPNVISRIGLRFPFYALFAAPTIYYLILGLRYGQRNYFILSGLALGLGLHGYSPFRIVPLVALIGFGMAFFANHSKKYKQNIFWYFCLLAFTALIIFLPLLRYAIENPVMFGIRAFSRLTSIEKPLIKPALEILIENLWNALTMFFYSNGEIWVHSIPNRPALDLITAVFFFIGLIVVIKKYMVYRRWEDLFLLALIPLLMLPSILSLAFPRENPCLNRTSAAIIPVFILAGSGLVYCYKKISSTLKNGFQRWIFIFCTGFLLLLTCSLNFQLVFNEFNKQFMEKAWNSSEMGNVIKDFVKNGGDPNLAFVVPYPYWVDTRLVGINAGYPTKDYALKPEQIIQTKWLPEPKIFIVYPEDNRAMQEVQSIYPNSRVETFNSKQPDKKFIIVRVG